MEIPNPGNPDHWEAMASEMREKADEYEEAVIWRQDRVWRLRNAADELTALVRTLRAYTPEDEGPIEQAVRITTLGLTPKEADELSYTTQQGEHDGERELVEVPRWRP